MALQKFVTPYKLPPRSLAQVEQFLRIDESSLMREIGQSIFDNAGLAFAYLGGSVADGFANQRSDLDIYMVYSAEIPADLKSVYRIAHGISVQLAATTLGSLRDNIEKLNAYQGLAGNLSEPRLQFFHRMARGVALRHESSFRAECERLDWRRFKSTCSAYAQFVADNNYEDAVGNVNSGNLDTALLIARQSVGHAMDALLALVGETTPGAKWRYDKAKRSLYDELPTLVEQCFALETSAVGDSAQSKLDFIADCTAMYLGLSDAKLLLERGCACSSLPAWLFCRGQKNALHLRQENIVMRTTPGSVPKLWRPDDTSEPVSDTQLLCWIALRTAADVPEVAARIDQLGVGRSVAVPTSQEEVESILADWRAQGFVATR